MADTKVTVAHVEPIPSVAKSGVAAEEVEIAQALQDYRPDTEAERKLVRKIDLRLMPILWIMYVLNYVDRTNIGNAKIAGMAKDLALDDQRYAWALSIFFFGYLLCEVPSNMILSRARPSLYLPSIMLIWGILSAAMASMPNFGALLAFRFILGCIESGFFPGVLFLMSCWYKPSEVGKRFAIFYSAAVISGAVGGIMAGAITGNLTGAHGIAGWRWLFIIEGVSTIGVSIIAFFILLDFPTTSSVLSLEERRLATVRLLAAGIESGDIDPNNRLTHWEAFKSAIYDYRTFLFMLLFVLDVGAGTISYFIPTITLTLGYSTVVAQYMTIPVYITAAVCLNIAAYTADRTGDRRWHIAGALGLGCTCAIVCAAVQTPVVRYVMLCFVAAGIWTALPLILAWISQTISLPAEKRAICLAMINAVGNLSSVYGAQIWPSTTAPRYTIGWGVTAAFLGAGTLLAILIPVILKLVPVRVTEAESRLLERKEILRIQAQEEVDNKAGQA